MALRKSSGNMYPWCGFMHSHLRGQCPHGCSYCYVQAHERRWKTGAFAGKLRLDERELKVRYGEGKTIFIEHQNDLFAEDVPTDVVSAVLCHCLDWPKNQYVFQTKNPAKLNRCRPCLPPNHLLGVTIESDLWHKSVMGKAPRPEERVIECQRGAIDFVTIEPILQFSPRTLAACIHNIHPRFVNIGADSKGHGLPEPPWSNVEELIRRIGDMGIEIRQKTNLDRLKKGTRHAHRPTQETHESTGVGHGPTPRHRRRQGDRRHPGGRA